MSSFVPIFSKTGEGTKVDRAANAMHTRPDNLIRTFFTDETLRALLLMCLRVDISDNNDKAEIVRRMLSEEDFVELGTGTNRMVFQYGGFAIKIALDRRGCVDNVTEAKRSVELPQYFAKTYETNLLINIAECVNSLDKTEFYQNEQPIKQILKHLSRSYLFNDIGFTSKNFSNWGWRPVPDSVDDDERELIILDYGYMYPLIGQSNTLFQCSKCGAQLRWKSAYTAFECSNAGCRNEYSIMDIQRRMDMTIINSEDELLQKLNGVGFDFNKLEQALAKLYV